MSLGVKWPPAVREERPVSYEICPLFTYSIFIGMYNYIFRGNFVIGRISIGIIFLGREISGGGTQGEFLH